MCVDSTSTWQRRPLGETGFWGQGHAPGPIACCAHARDLKIVHNLEWGCECPGKASRPTGASRERKEATVKGDL